MGFGGWQGGSVVVVASRCHDGFAWWWLSFFLGVVAGYAW